MCDILPEMTPLAQMDVEVLDLDRHVPINRMLVELSELPVHWEDVHVVVLLEVMGQKVHGVVSSLQPLLVFKDFLHLDKDSQGSRNRYQGAFTLNHILFVFDQILASLDTAKPILFTTQEKTTVFDLINKMRWTYSELLLLSEQVVVLVSLEEGHQDVLEPVPHTHGEFTQLDVHTGGNDWVGRGGGM